MQLYWGASPKFVIEPAQGDISLIPEKRKWLITLRGFEQNIQVQVFLNGKRVSCDVCKNLQTHSASVSVCASVTDLVELQISGETLIHNNSDVEAKWLDILQRSQLGYNRKLEIAKQLRKEENVHKRLMWITGERIEEHQLEMAIREVLTLSADEYDTFVDGWPDP